MYNVTFFTKGGKPIEFDEITTIEAAYGNFEMYDIDDICFIVDMNKIESVHIETYGGRE